MLSVFHSVPVSPSSNSVLVVVPNVTIVPTPPAPAPLIEGRDALILDCEVEANPEPSISWYKDINTESGGVPRLQEIARGPQYKVETVSRHDAGLYTCIATNIIGESDRGDFAIDVHCEYDPDLTVVRWSVLLLPPV